MIRMDGDSTLKRMRRTQKQKGESLLQDSHTQKKGNIVATAAYCHILLQNEALTPQRLGVLLQLVLSC